MIVKTDKGYVVVSKEGKKLSKPMGHKAAIKRLQQIEKFKRMKNGH